MRTRLSADQLSMIREVLQSRVAGLTAILLAAESDRLTAEQRRQLVDIIGEEFTRSGVGSDNEPTQRGIELERLLDAVNKPLLFGEPSGQ